MLEISSEVALISRHELVRRLAAVSHKTWMRQKHRDNGVAHEDIPSAVTDYDLERAEDAVAELERLGLYPPGSRETAVKAGRSPRRSSGERKDRPRIAPGP